MGLPPPAYGLFFKRALKVTGSILGVTLIACPVAQGWSVPYVEGRSRFGQIAHMYYNIYMRSKGYFLRRKLEWDTERADTIQIKLLRNIIEANANTVYGVDHNYSKLLALNDTEFLQTYQHQPSISYTELDPYLTRIIQGEQKVLSYAPVVHLAQTKGGHLLPRTPQSLKIMERYGKPFMYQSLFQARPGSFISLQKTLRIFNPNPKDSNSDVNPITGSKLPVVEGTQSLIMVSKEESLITLIYSYINIIIIIICIS